jgi:hypothetical protein
VEVFTAASLSALVVKFTSFLKYLAAADFRAAVTQAIPWVAGFMAVLVAAQADVSQGIVVFGTTTLGQLDVWSQMLAGLALGSAGSLAYDFKKSFDNTDSASEPKLGGGG